MWIGQQFVFCVSCVGGGRSWGTGSGCDAGSSYTHAGGALGGANGAVGVQVVFYRL